MGVWLVVPGPIIHPASLYLPTTLRRNAILRERPILFHMNDLVLVGLGARIVSGVLIRSLLLRSEVLAIHFAGEKRKVTLNRFQASFAEAGFGTRCTATQISEILGAVDFTYWYNASIHTLCW